MAARKLTNVLCMDVVGYSKLMNQDELAALLALEQARNIVDPCIKQFNGRIFNTAGDSVLAEFASTVDMVKCAIQCQNQFSTTTTRWRIGLHLGDVAVDGNNLLGDGVNVCARIESLADHGGISMSDIVHRSVVGLVPAKYVDQGQQTLKNIPRPMQLWGIEIIGSKPNPNRVGTQLGITAKQIRQDSALTNVTLERALSARRTGDQELAVRVLLYRSLNQDKTAWSELANMLDRKLVPEKYWAAIAEVLDPLMRIADHKTTLILGNCLAANKLGSEYSGRAVQHWYSASEMLPEAAVKLAEYVFNDPNSGGSEIAQVEEVLEHAGRRGSGEAALLLGKHYKNTNKKLSVTWLLAARYLKQFAAQGLMDTTARGMTHAELVSAKIDGDALVDEIKWVSRN